MDKLRVKDKLKGCEIFYSIQGEGPTTGTPAIFIRLSMCNLQCVWCDTKFTWDWKVYDPEKEIELCDKDTVLDYIKAHNLYENFTPHIVITGGEPLLQQDLLIPLLKELKEYYIEVETNGTIRPKLEFEELVNQFNVSPKLMNSLNKIKARYKPKVLKELVMLPATSDVPFQNVNFKFVVTSELDLKEILLIQRECGIASESIYIMPESTSGDEIKEKADWIAKICINTGFKFCNRLQVAMWGNERER